MTAADTAREMDRIYRHQRHIYDFTRRYFLLGRDRMIADLKPPAGGTVLEIGCGTARNLLKAAELYPDARLYGLDISAEMLATARRGVARSPHANRIVLAEADAAQFNPSTIYGVHAFDRIFISYAISMIPGWRKAISGAARHLTKNGSLHIVDFGSMDDLPAFARSALVAWLAHFGVTPRRDLEEEIMAIAGALGLRAEFRHSPRGYAAQAVLYNGNGSLS